MIILLLVVLALVDARRRRTHRRRRLAKETEACTKPDDCETKVCEDNKDTATVEATPKVCGPKADARRRLRRRRHHWWLSLLKISNIN